MNQYEINFFVTIIFFIIKYTLNIELKKNVINKLKLCYALNLFVYKHITGVELIEYEFSHVSRRKRTFRYIYAYIYDIFLIY